MYNVSPEYLESLHSFTRNEYCRGTIGNFSFTDANIISLNYSNRCTDTDDITYGSSYIGQITATLKDIPITRGNWSGQVITIEVGQRIDDDTIEWVPLGVFTVAEAKIIDVGIEILANDNLIKLDKGFNAEQQQVQAGTVYDIAAWVCRWCGVEFGQTREEIAAMPNGEMVFTLYRENDIATYRDCLSKVAELIGGFVTCNRHGQIVFKSFKYEGETVNTITASDRINGGAFSDFITDYEGCCLELDNGKEKYATGANPNGNTILLGKQPYMQLGLDTTINGSLATLTRVAKSIKVNPFEFSILSTIVYDLGDYITCSGGLLGNEPVTCLINSINWTLKELTAFEGFGADPNIKHGASSTDKEISGVASKVNSNEINYYTYTNISQLDILSDTETEVGNIIFASNKNTDVNISTEIKFKSIAEVQSQERVPVYQDTPDPLDPSGDPITSEIGYWIKTITEPITVHVRYYYDNDLIFHEPIETMAEDGWHTLHYGYLLHDVDESLQHNWRVTLEIGDGSALIDPDGVLLILGGQGLVAEDRWDGTVTAKDEIPTAKITGLKPEPISDSAPTISLQAPEVVTASDAVPAAPIEGMTAEPIEETNLNIVLRNLLFNFVTEDKTANITVEDKTANITTEED